jgi:hypothetical protein
LSEALCKRNSNLIEALFEWALKKLNKINSESSIELATCLKEKVSERNDMHNHVLLLLYTRIWVEELGTQD